jgi:ribosomal protein S18 acetylase RimI-like enzyme
MAEEDDEMRERAQKLISFGELSPKNVDQLRKLNLAVFPVRYNDKFYNDLSSNPVQLYTHLAYFSDIMVGAICSRVEPQEGNAFKVYIMTIGVLAPYRRLGIGKRLLQQTLEACSTQPDCQAIYLHVQVGNDEAVKFYRGFGFEVGEVIKDYYTRLDVNDAHVISKQPPFV